MNTERPDSGHMVDRMGQFEKEPSLPNRELVRLEDQLAELEVRLKRLEPLLRAWSIVQFALRFFVTVTMLPVYLIRALANVPAITKRLKDSQFRSERLVKDVTCGDWISKLDRRAYFRHAIQAIGLSQPTIYRVDPRQRPLMAHRPRILHIIPNVWLGGSTQLVLDLHNHLGHRFEMEVVTSTLPSHGRHDGMKIHVVPRSSPRHEVRRIFSRFRPHITHIHYWGDVDTPWYRTFFEMAANSNCRILQNVNTPVTPFTSVQVTRNVFVSQTILDLFGSAAPSQVIYPGINLSMFSPAKAIDPDAYDAIGMVYRLECDKLSESSIEPLITVVKRRPQTRVIVVGDGSLFTHFRSRVRDENLLNRFEFTGYVPYEDLPSYYARFKIFVAPVWQESFGQVIPFAMSMGLAVAGNHVGAIPEILGDESTLGTNSEETASHILRLLENRDMIDVIGARNRSIALANFSVERMAIAYANAYKAMIPEGVELMPDYPSAVYFPL
jgi:glycosyltransferase involved in cell wall biosynthesis